MKRTVLFILPFLFPLVLVAQSVKMDNKIGDQQAKKVEAQMGLYDNAEMNDYLRAVGNRLVSHLENPLFPYEFNLVPDMSPNAFALPGGHIYVTTGLIPLLANEDELACIIGHEIIHSNNRHTVKQIKKSILPSLLEIPGNLLGMVNTNLGVLVNSPIKTSNKLLFASYGREFETEADKEGVKLASAAGYDPNGLILSLNRLSKAVEVITESAEKRSYFSDHPYTPDRTEAAEKVIAKLEWKKSEQVSKNLLYEFDGILFGESPRNGVIVQNQFLHPELNFSIQFPKNWLIDNQPDYLAAYEPTKKAAFILFLDDPKLSPKEAALNFIDSLGTTEKSKMISQEVYNIKGKEGYGLTFKELIDSETMNAYVLWLPMEGKLFRLVGVGAMEYRKQLEDVVNNLNTLSEKDKSKIKINLIKVVPALEGETLTKLSKRTNNGLNLELLGIINSKSLDVPLLEGELMRVVIEEEYFSYIKK